MDLPRVPGSIVPPDGRVRRVSVLWLIAVACMALSAGAWLAHRSEVRTLDELARRVRGEGPKSSEEILVTFTDFVHRSIRNPGFSDLPPLVRAYYWLNPVHPGPGDVIRWGSDYRGGCGSHTGVLVAMLRASGIEARPFFLLDSAGSSRHTVVQARIDGRWVISDPNFGILYRRRDGVLATAQEIAADEPRFEEQVASVPGYNPVFRYDHVALLNWRKVPVLLPALRRLLVFLLGEERVGNLARPDVWMWPRAMLALVGLCGAIVCAGGAAWSDRALAPAPARDTRRARRMQPVH
jgi:hypothetical protein